MLYEVITAAVQRARSGHKEHHRRLEQDGSCDGTVHRIVLVCRLFRPRRGYRSVWNVYMGKLGSADLSRAAEEELRHRTGFIRYYSVISVLPAYLLLKLRKGCDDTWSWCKRSSTFSSRSWVPYWFCLRCSCWFCILPTRITSYNVCYTKLLRPKNMPSIWSVSYDAPIRNAAVKSFP